MTPQASAPRKIVALLAQSGEALSSALGPLYVACGIAAGKDAQCIAMVLSAAEADGELALASGATSAYLIEQAASEAPSDPRRQAAIFAEALEAVLAPDEMETAIVVGATDHVGLACLGFLAERFDGVALGLCQSLSLSEAGIEAERPAFGGRARMQLAAAGRPCFVALHTPASPEVSCAKDAQKTIGHLKLQGDLPEALSLDLRPADGGRAALEGTRVIVSGGRGVTKEEGFEALFGLASLFGGAVAGSLPSVDAGLVPVSHQVGQSGKFVTPDLYIAVGISGTPQHMAGVGENTRIIAINPDAQADIFKVAEIGAVADWQDLVPELVAALKASL